PEVSRPRPFSLRIAARAGRDPPPMRGKLGCVRLAHLSCTRGTELDMFSGTMDVSAPLPTDYFTTLRTWSYRALAFTQSERFGNAVIILFFLAQALDG